MRSTSARHRVVHGLWLTGLSLKHYGAVDAVSLKHHGAVDAGLRASDHISIRYVTEYKGIIEWA